ncbi:long-chain fatty acid transporter fat1 [Elasticomyces elasticus]|uniref:Long-chain fatty acid transporter fat1 n=1 Tax=Elasticomyces elasticus TaxID=574655 RepID=A0AAN7ZZQ2_9PEZI|nr:long-chain fatty acid transporter fat1 [Elasticomyces elasticus]
MPPANQSVEACANYVVRISQTAVQRFAVESKRQARVPDVTTITKPWSDQIDELLGWLETEAQVTPDLKQRSKLDVVLGLMFRKPEYHFPRSIAERAETLYERFDSARWGAPIVVKTESSDEDGDSNGDEVMSDDPATSRGSLPGRRRQRQDSIIDSLTVSKVVKLPPADHPIWGVHGIMHGVARTITIKRDGRKRYWTKSDPRYLSEKRNANIHGHNGIEVGAWFPRQLVAILRGAHGELQGGISGSGESGAYSVVSSGAYDRTDRDRGNILLYSAAKSDENEDPRVPAQRSAALAASYVNRRPVRVLRSKGTSRFSPVCGLRYDGLYRVTDIQHPTNARGGMFEQFELTRVDGQMPLERALLRPNSQEVRDAARIEMVSKLMGVNFECIRHHLETAECLRAAIVGYRLLLRCSRER